MMLFAAGFSHATTSVVKLSVGANSNCNSLTTETITQARDNNYTGTPPSNTGSGTFDIVTGPDGQVFEYQLSNTNKSIEWKVTNPNPETLPTTLAKRVNYILLKQQGNNPTIAAYYAESGAFRDTGVTTSITITGVTFCYGRSLPPGSQTSPLIAPTTCKDKNGNTIIECSVPSDGKARVISIFDEPDDGASNWQVSTCSCADGQAFTECDPNLPAGSPGSCTKGPTLDNPNVDGTLKFLPSSMEFGLNPESYYCTVIFGSKRCWSK